MMITSLLRILFIVPFSAFVAALELLMIPFNRDGRLFHALAKFWARVVLKVGGVTLQVTGLERVDFHRGSYIYVSNHASLFDIPSILAGIPDQIRIIYKKELERIPIFGWGLKYGKTYIGIDRKKGQDAIQSLEEAATKIREGASVILFAEGTRSNDGHLQPFKRGPFNLAVRARVPIVPVAISGSYVVLPAHTFRIRPGTVTVTLSEPIDIPEVNGKETELQLRDRVHSVIQQHLQQE
jgi:1-acyl-sn-glycerol-3-phosphate acyltransferase